MSNKTYYNFLSDNEYLKFNEDKDFNKVNKVEYTKKLESNENIGKYNFSLPFFELKNNKELNRYIYNRYHYSRPNISLMGNTNFVPFQKEPQQLGTLYTDNIHSHGTAIDNEMVYLERKYHKKNVENIKKMNENVETDINILF